MVKRYTEELNNEELKAVFNANMKLQEQVLEDAIDSEMYSISEMLDYLKPSLRDWSIGTYQHNYLTVGDSVEFIANLLAVQEDYGLFSDDEKHIITDTEAIVDKYMSMEGPEEEDFEDEYGELNEDAYEAAGEEFDEELEEAEEAAEKAVKKLAEAVADKFSTMLEYYNYNAEALETYFLEFYAENRLDGDNYYIDTERENPYELFQDVAYTKSFK